MCASSMFPIYNELLELLVENLRFSLFLPTSLVWSPRKLVLWDLGINVGLPGLITIKIAWLQRHQFWRSTSMRRTDRRTDGRTRRLSPSRAIVQRISHCVSCSTSVSSTQRTTTANYRVKRLPQYCWPHHRRDDGRAWFTTAVVWRQVE